MQTTECSHRSALGEVATLSHEWDNIIPVIPGLTLEITDWRSWTCTGGSCHIQEGKIVFGKGVNHPILGSSNLFSPNGAGITNTGGTIGRADLAAIIAAVARSYSYCY